MSVIGPRPQLVRDMVFMTPEQRMRHTAKPGLSGLAQVNGRNAISWEDKLEWDQKYIKKVSLSRDIKIILQTVEKAFVKQEGITEEDMATAEDMGDYLLRTGKIEAEEYREKQTEAKMIINGKSNTENEEERVIAVKESAESKKYSVLMSLYKKEKPALLKKIETVCINETSISTINKDKQPHLYRPLFKKEAQIQQFWLEYQKFGYEFLANKYANCNKKALLKRRIKNNIIYKKIRGYK